jgi:hypothetical protein
MDIQKIRPADEVEVEIKDCHLLFVDAPFHPGQDTVLRDLEVMLTNYRRGGRKADFGKTILAKCQEHRQNMASWLTVPIEVIFLP